MLIWKNKRGSNRSDEDVKRRSRFESRRFRRYEADEDSKNIENPSWIEDVDSISYTKFANKLKDSVSDPKAKAWIDYAFGDKNNDDIKFKAGSPEPIDVAALRPTQNFIGLENSIGFTVNNPDKAGKTLKTLLMEDSPSVTISSPVWVFEGKYIIDGHHRWSQAFAFNPKSKIMAVNFTCSEKLSPQQALAAVQGVIASVVGKVPMATSKVDGQDKVASNVLKDSDTKMLKAAEDCLVNSPSHDEFNKLCDEVLESGKGIATKISRIDAKFDNNSSGAKVLTSAVKNCLDLKQEHNAVDGAPDREVMPQTDGGKGAPGDTPNKVKDKLEVGVDDVITKVNTKAEFRLPRAIHKKYID